MPSTMPSACRVGRSKRPRRGSAARCATAFPKTFGERAKEAGRIFSDYFAAASSGAAAGNAWGGRTSARPCRLRPASGRRQQQAGPLPAAGGRAPGLDRPFRPAGRRRGRPAWTSRPSSRSIWPWRRAGSPRGPDVWFVGDTDIDMNLRRQRRLPARSGPARARQAGEFDAYPPALHLRDCAGLAARLHALGVLPSPNI